MQQDASGDQISGFILFTSKAYSKYFWWKLERVASWCQRRLLAIHSDSVSQHSAVRHSPLGPDSLSSCCHLHDEKRKHISTKEESTKFYKGYLISERKNKWGGRKAQMLWSKHRPAVKIRNHLWSRTALCCPTLNRTAWIYQHQIREIWPTSGSFIC